MNIQYLGTAAAEGWPAPFCACPVCSYARAARGRNLRTRTQALIGGVAGGLGVAVLPLSLIRPALDRGSVCQFWVEGIRFTRRFRLLYHRNKYLTRPMEAMIRLCRETWA